MKKIFNPKKVIIVFIVFGIFWIVLSGILSYTTSRYPNILIRRLIYKETLLILIFLAAQYWLANRYWTMLATVENELKAQREQYKILTDIDTDSIIIINEDSKITFANPATENIFGYQPNEIIGKSVTMLMPADYRHRHLKALGEYVRTHRKSFPWKQIEFLGLHKNGKEIPLELSINEYHRDGKHLFIGIARDVTERKRAEQSLLEEKGFLDEVVNSLPGIFYIFDSFGNFVRWNKNVEEVSGYSTKEMSSKRPLDFFTEEDKSLMAKKITEAFKKGKTNAEVAFLTGGGKKIPFYFTGVRLIKDDKLYFIGEAIDITERKKAEKKLRQKDQEIRKAYVDVFNAVTGGKLIIMTDDELKSALGNPVTDVFKVATNKYLGEARMLIKEALEENFPSIEEADEIILAANEALTNCVKHAGGGNLTVLKLNNIAQILISDSGPGIDFSLLPKATLLAGFSTKKSLGMGFSVMLEICDRVLLSTRPVGTDIVLELISDHKYFLRSDSESASK